MRLVVLVAVRNDIVEQLVESYAQLLHDLIRNSLVIREIFDAGDYLIDCLKLVRYFDRIQIMQFFSGLCIIA